MRRLIVYFFTAIYSATMLAQYNVNMVVEAGRASLYYEDFVLSIQYFNKAINLKPFLWEPWQLRGIAKFSLEDYAGAEADATQAISLNPYISRTYDLRALSRIRQENFDGAIEDYRQAIKQDPMHKEFWYNMAVCHLEKKEYDEALNDVDTILRKWENYIPTYVLKSEIMLRKKDTLSAYSCAERALQLDQYNAQAWRVKAYIELSQEKWAAADSSFSKVIHFKPKQTDCYLNRAVARLKLNNLRGTMDDYDMALELDPTNFLGHYNRGLLRQQLGDDNRAIEDFNFVLSLEPDNIMALFNRATLLDRTGNLKAAIRDYSKVIDEFPNFWTGLHYRAGCYRRLGMTAKAETDEFRILKAQMDKHLGIQPRWTRKKLSEIRKKWDIDPEKYNQIVVDDETPTEQEYKTEYRGHVQNRRVLGDLQPYIVLSLQEYTNILNSYKPFLREVDEINAHLPLVQLHLAMMPYQLSEDEAKTAFQLADTLAVLQSNTVNPDEAKYYIVARCAANTLTQNYQEAINDADLCLEVDSTMAFMWCQKAVCEARLMEYEKTSSPANNNLRAAGIIADFARAQRLAPDNAFIYYCRGTFHAQRNDDAAAIECFTKAIELDPSFPEAYFNRGIVNLRYGNKEKAIIDLGKAGELGLYSAYSIIKSNSKK